MTEEMIVENGAGRTRRVPVDYPSNSKKHKALGVVPDADTSQIRAKRVTTEDVQTRKPSFSRRLTENFTGDVTQNVIEYIFFQVLMPAAKNMLAEAVSNGANAFSEGMERALFGDVRSRPKAGYTNYNRVRTGNGSVGYGGREVSTRTRAAHRFDDVIFRKYSEAEVVLEALQELVERYESASVADFYSAAGASSQFTDEQWGWTNLRGALVQNVRGGYVIRFPRPEQFD